MNGMLPIKLCGTLTEYFSFTSERYSHVVTQQQNEADGHAYSLVWFACTLPLVGDDNDIRVCMQCSEKLFRLLLRRSDKVNSSHTPCLPSFRLPQHNYIVVTCT